MKTRNILVRFDDICPTMNFEQFQKACDLMDKYGVKPLIGVIPDCRDKDLSIESDHADFWNFVKFLQKKGYAIAMHGVNHVFCSKHRGVANNRIGSEFAGVPLEEQIRKIEMGKQILENHDIKTNIFFAPAHSYDWNTLKALSKCGFKYMSDGKSAMPYVKNGIICIPCRASGCPKIKSYGYYTAVFHAHEWVRKEKEYDYKAFCDLLEKFHADIVTFEEYAKAPAGKALIQRIDEQIYLKWIFELKPLLSKIYHTIR